MNTKVLYFENDEDLPKIDKSLSNKIINFTDTKIINHNIKDLEINIHFVSKKKMRLINNKFRNIDKPTDVLSFPIYENIKQINSSHEQYIVLGDIFICPAVAKEQISKNSSLDTEIGILALHGLKHLVGIHHK